MRNDWPLATKRAPTPRSAWVRAGTTPSDVFWVLGWMGLVFAQAPPWMQAAWMVVAVAHSAYSKWPRPTRDPAVERFERVAEAQDRLGLALASWSVKSNWRSLPAGAGWQGERAGLRVTVTRTAPPPIVVTGSWGAAGAPDPPPSEPHGWTVAIEVPSLADVDAVVQRPDGEMDWSRGVLIGARSWRHSYHCVGRFEWATLLLVPGSRGRVGSLIAGGASVGRGKVVFGPYALATLSGELGDVLDDAIRDCSTLDAMLVPERRAALLRDALSDPGESPPLRRNALSALCTRWGHESGTAIAVRAAMSDPHATVAMEAVARYAEPDDRPLVEAATDFDRSDRHRAIALWRLAERGGGGQLGAAAAVRAWTEGGRESRSGALQVAGALGMPCFADWVRHVVTTEHLVESGAGWLLPDSHEAGSTWPDPVVGADTSWSLVDWRHENEGTARVIPHEVLLPAPPERPAGRDAARLEASPEVRMLAHAAAYAVQRHGDAKCAEVGVELLYSPAPGVRAAGVDFVRRLAAPNSLGGLVRAVSDAPITDDQRATLRRVIYAIEQRHASTAGAVSVVEPSSSGAVSVVDDRGDVSVPANSGALDA